MFSQMISEITTLHHVDDKVEILSVLECIVHVDQEPVKSMIKIILNLRMKKL